MEAKSWENISHLIEDFKDNPSAYSMFYAIYLAETAVKKLYPEQNFDKLDQKGLKFRAYEHYSYFPNNIRGFQYKDQVMTFVINLFGLYGKDSPLPRCYHEQVAIQQNIHEEGKIPLQNFFDIFNNRFYWLYYQAWKKYRFYLQISNDPNNKVLQRVFAFIGQGPEFVKQKPSINVYRLMQLSGILSARIRNKKGLLILLQEFFPTLKFRIKEFIPSMVKIDEQPKIGSRSGDQVFLLGKNSLVGRSVLDYMSRICIEIGPMNFNEYLDFLPNGKYAKLLKELLNLYLNDGLEYDLRCFVRSSSIKTISWNDKRVKLGQSFWLGTPKKDFEEVYFKYEKYVSV